MSTSQTGNAPPANAVDWRLRLPFYYGWFIAIASAVTLGLAYTTWYSFSVFYVALLETYGWSRAASAGVFSAFVIVVGLAGAGAGVLADRYGPGRVGTAGSLLLAAGLLASSWISELWHFYVIFGVVCAAGLAAAGWIPSVAMIGRWFSAKYGSAIGVASAGIGVGIVVMVPATQMVINAYGWRTAYVVLAVVVLVGVAPFEAIFLRGRPEDIGLLRDGRKSQELVAGIPTPTSPTRVVDRSWTERNWTIGSALRTRRYWLLFLMLALGNISAQMLMVHEVAFLVDGGYDKLFAASIMGLVGLISIGAKIGWGWASDRLGRELTWTLGFAALVLGIGFLAATRLVPSTIVVFLFALTFSLGYAVAPPLGPATAADLFAGRRFGSIYGTLGVGNGIGSASGAWAAGYIFDATGSYLPALALGAFTAVLSAAAMWLAAPSKVRVVMGKASGRPAPHT